MIRRGWNPDPGSRPETFSASTRAVIGQFTFHILLYDPLKFKVVFVAKLFRD